MKKSFGEQMIDRLSGKPIMEIREFTAKKNWKAPLTITNHYQQTIYCTNLPKQFKHLEQCYPLGPNETICLHAKTIYVGIPK